MDCRELLNCVPVRLQKVHSPSEARRQLSRYADGARRLADWSRTMTAEQRKQIKWQCREMIDWLRQTEKSGDASIDEYLVRLLLWFFEKHCSCTTNGIAESSEISAGALSIGADGCSATAIGADLHEIGVAGE